MIAGIAAAAFGLPLLWSLSRPIPFRLEEPLAINATQPLIAVQIPELTYLRTRGGQSTYRLRLAASQASKLLQQPEIRLRVADYEKTRTIVSAAISAPAANCGYSARTGERFPSNGALLFVRREACAPVSDDAHLELILTIQLDRPGPIGVWTSEAPPPRPGMEIFITDRSSGNVARDVVGSAGRSDQSESMSRLALLNYVWQVSQSTWWLIASFVIAATLVAIGVFVLADTRIVSGETSISTRTHSAIGAACVALAFAVGYACAIPPFQAADESHHFAGLAAFLGTPELDVEATHLSQVGHVDQIRFHPEEHFNPSDVGHLGEALTVGIVPDADVRGTGVFAVWYVFAPLLRGRGPAETLLTARVLNALVFSAAVGLFVYLVAAFTPSRWPMLDVFPILIIPTMPFFGMQLSNYAPLCAAYIVIAAAVSILAWDGPQSWVAGPVLGGAWAGAILLSRSALPLAPLLLACVLARLTFHRDGRRESAGTVIAFWVGLSLPCAVALALLPGPLRELVERALALTAGTHERGAVAALPWILIGAAVAGAMVEMRWRTSEGQRQERVDRFVIRVAWVGAVLVGVSMALSLFISYPGAPPPDQAHVTSPGRYVAGMLLAGFTMFRFRHPDFMTSTSFWGAFGWLDTILPEWAVTTLAVSSGLALSATLVWIARKRRGPSGAVFLLILGLVAGFALSAFSVIRTTPAALHGRYLLGIYICLLTLCWHFLPQLSFAMTPRTRSIVLSTCALVTVTIHAWSTVTILNRYFG